MVWMGDSLDDLRGFPRDAQKKIGRELNLVQRGLTPRDWKPMKTVGRGVCEIRVHTRLEHRAIYIAQF